VSKSPYNTKSFAYPGQRASNVAGMHPYMPSLVQSQISSTSPDDERTSSHVLQSLARARVLGDAPRPPMFPPMFPPIFLCQLCIFLLIVASPRRSALVAPIPESDDHVP